MFRDLLNSQYISHYNITTRDLSAVSLVVVQQTFDLDDDDNQPISVKPTRNGKLTIAGNTESVEIVAYDHFCKQIKKPLGFVTSRKHCDYILSSIHNSQHFMLIELTSALGGIHNLLKPITNKKGVPLYIGGKYEKAEAQLSDSLSTIIAVPDIQTFISRFSHKVCLLGYSITQYTDPAERATHPFSRYLEIEAAETGRNGAIIHNSDIESHGFEYRRINHIIPYTLPQPSTPHGHPSPEACEKNLS